MARGILGSALLAALMCCIRCDLAPVHGLLDRLSSARPTAAFRLDETGRCRLTRGNFEENSGKNRGKGLKILVPEGLEGPQGQFARILQSTISNLREAHRIELVG